MPFHLKLRAHSIPQHISLITLQNLPSLAPESLAPDTVPTGRQNAIRVQGIFDALVELSKRAIVPAVSFSHLVGEQEMCPVLAVTQLRGLTDHLSHQTGRPVLRVRVGAVVNDVGDIMTLTRRDADGRQNVESPFGMQPRDDAMDRFGVLAFGWRNRSEEEMGGVRHPVQPVELPKYWDTTADLSP